MAITTRPAVVLERASQQFVAATAKPPLRNTHAARAAVAQAISILSDALHSS